MGIQWDHEKVREAIYKKGWSLQDLEKASGVAIGTSYGAFYRDQESGVETVKKWAEALGLEVRALYTDVTKRMGKREFAVNLIALEFRRAEMDMTKGELAKKCGWHQSKLTDILNRGECGLWDAENLAWALEMPVAELEYRRDRK